MQSIDRNDVNISTLFKWNTKYTIKDSQEEDIQDVYVRIVGDAELNRARVYALRKSAEMRRKLHDKNSDEYLAYIPELDLIDDGVLVESALMQWTRQYAQDAVRELKFNLPIEPDSNASLEDQEKYQQTVDNWPNMREEAIRKFIEDKLEKKRKELNELPKEVIYKEYIKMVINKICEDEMLNSFREMCAYLGTYSDETFTKLLFESFDEFSNSSSSLKSQLLGVYMSLEMDGENLKKLQEVTQ